MATVTTYGNYTKFDINDLTEQQLEHIKNALLDSHESWSKTDSAFAKRIATEIQTIIDVIVEFES